VLFYVNKALVLSPTQRLIISRKYIKLGYANEKGRNHMLEAEAFYDEILVDFRNKETKQS
jgi:hypothetical protein